ncbi:MAG: lytic transglycosylase domain-containing protein [Pseudomonadota bacterium]
MLAKSISALFPNLDTVEVARRTRNAVSILVFIASLFALLLIIHAQYGSRFTGDSRSRMLSMGALKPAASGESATREAANPEVLRYRVLAEFLAKRYKVSQDVTFDLVSIAHGAGYQLGLDPLLIMAIIAVESRYNPIAESVAGAKGLMQIIPKYHTDKLDEFGGEKAIFDPATNILVGSQILKEYLRRTGNLGIALQMYAGALNDEQDVYTSRVLGEKQRLQQVVGRHAGRNIQIKSSAGGSSPSSPL